MRRVALIVTAGLAACQSVPVTSPSPVAFASPTPTDVATSSATATLAPTATPTPAPTATGAATAGPTASPASDIMPDSFVQVVTDDLRVRSAPGVGEDSRKLEPLAQRGLRAIVIEGPVAADGYAWYRIRPYTETDDHDFPWPPAGWVAAASRDGEPWLLEDDVCGDSSGPAVWPAGEMAPPAGPKDLACYGGRDVDFSGFLGLSDTGTCFEFEGIWAVEPAWLDPCGRSWFLAQQPDWSAPQIWPALAPDAQLGFDPATERGLRDGAWEFADVPEPTEWLTVGGTGRYDHPAARTCRAVPSDSSEAVEPPEPAVVVYECRTTFVVTSLGLRGP